MTNATTPRFSVIVPAFNAEATVAAAIASVQNTDPTDSVYGVVVRAIQRYKPTYVATFRLAARPYALSKAFTANTRVQFATIHHAATATKTVKIRRVEVAIESSSVFSEQVRVDERERDWENTHRLVDQVLGSPGDRLYPSVSIPSDAKPYVSVPKGTRAVSVQLTYADGTQSEVKTFRR